MNASDVAFAVFVVVALAAASVWIAVKVTGPTSWTPTPRRPTARQQWQTARQEAMQVVRDRWTCRQIEQLPTSTESND